MGWGYEMIEWMNEPRFRFGDLEFSVARILTVILAVLLTFAVAKLVRRLLQVRLFKKSTMDQGVQNAVATLTYYTLIVVGLGATISHMGLDLTSIALFSGALGLGIGIGLQEVARNFVSGIVLLLGRTVRPGDRIEVGDLEADVSKIGGHSTVLITRDQAAIVVPNSWLLTSNLINWTLTGAVRRLRFNIGVSYKSDPDQVTKALISAALRAEGVLQEPEPYVVLTGFADSSIEFGLTVFTSSHLRRPARLKSNVLYQVIHEFREQGIEIPYPQRDLHFRSSEFPFKESV
jgi:small-conductance mechanosensitive channel